MRDIEETAASSVEREAREVEQEVLVTLDATTTPDASVASLQEEVEDLRAKLTNAVERWNQSLESTERISDENDRLREEVEQLRKALKEIASYHPSRNVADLRCIADDALKGEQQRKVNTK